MLLRCALMFDELLQLLCWELMYVPVSMRWDLWVCRKQSNKHTSCAVKQLLPTHHTSASKHNLNMLHINTVIHSNIGCIHVHQHRKLDQWFAAINTTVYLLTGWRVDVCSCCWLSMCWWACWRAAVLVTALTICDDWNIAQWDESNGVHVMLLCCAVLCCAVLCCALMLTICCCIESWHERPCCLLACPNVLVFM
jgi:hypothetical protein